MDFEKEYTEVVNLLKKQFGADLKCIVLFGSRSRGDNREESDHDLLLIIDNLPSEPITRMRLVRTALFESNLRINTIAATVFEFTKDITPLIMDICNDGKCLYGNDFFEPLRQKVMSIMHDAGLYRQHFGRDFFWQFKKPSNNDWELTWAGFHEFKK